jgi:ribosomal protein L3 glutamine methyltransferase
VTLQQLVKQTAQRFRAAKLRFGHGTTNAHDEAAFLALRGLGLPFDADASMEIDAAGIRRIESLARKRIDQRMPVPYLLNEAWLADIAFYVDRRVIIPRSHIAVLLQRRLEPCFARAPRRVLDLCTGSGCLAVLAARAFPRASVDAVDLSKAALEVARRNIKMHGLSRQVRLLRSDLFDAVAGERYDLILSNPPYVTAASMRNLPPEYRHEPGIALAGGGDGLALIRRILDSVRVHLKATGFLVCEIGSRRRALERAYPRTEFVWPETAAGAGQVFLLPASAFSNMG